MFDTAEDEQVRVLAAKRLLQITSLEEREAISRVLKEMKSLSGRCPAEWREAAAALRAVGLRVDASGAPLDPTGAPYTLEAGDCEAKLDEHSEIPKK
jgi:hypothetical protein